jgi:hypothetical protein
MSHSARHAAMTHSWDSVFEKVYARYEDVLVAGWNQLRPPMPLALAP